MSAPGAPGAKPSPRPGPRGLWIALLVVQALFYVFLTLGRGGASEASVWGNGGLVPAAFEGSGGHPSSAVPVLRALGLAGEELLLGVGCWSLARYYFATPCVAYFVCASGLGSAVAWDPQGLSLHFVYALPLLILLLHRALDEGSRSKCYLAGNLLGLQILSSPPGTGVAGLVAAGLCFVAAESVLGRPILLRLKEFGWTRSTLALGVALLATWLPLGWLSAAAPTVAPLASGSPLEASREGVSGAALPASLRGIDLLIGARGPLYCGMLTLGFSVIAIAALPKSGRIRRAAILAAVILVLVAGLGGAGAVLGSPAPLYSAGLAVARLTLAFVAGWGLERTLQNPRPGPLRLAGTILVSIGAVLFAGSFAAMARPRDSGVLDPQYAGSGAALPGASRIADLLGSSALSAALGGGLLLVWGSRRRAVPLTLGLVLLFHPLDLFGWKFRTVWWHTSAAGRFVRATPSGPLPDHSLKDEPPSRAAGRRLPGSFLSVPALLVASLSGLYWLVWALRAAGRMAIRGAEPL